MIKKSIFLLFAGYIISLISACICNNTKYVDFDEISILVDEPLISTGDSLLMYVEAVDPRFIGQASPGLSLFPTAYAAIDCDYGWGGLKFPISSVSITSNQDFNDDYPAGTELSPLFLLDTYTYEAPGSERIKPLGEVNPQELIPSELILYEIPTASKAHILKIEITRTKGDTLIAFSPTLSWE
ncbi:MAG: hypothetical protein AAF824_10310 [Bacteroidota bacterium]